MIDFVDYLEEFIEENLTYQINCTGFNLDEVRSVICGYKSNYFGHRLYLTVDSICNIKEFVKQVEEYSGFYL